MSCKLLASISKVRSVPLSSLPVGAHAIVSSVLGATTPRIEQLLWLGVTPGALVTMTQRFPGIVFLCDHTELAVERAVADVILVRPLEGLQ
jgi:Fe2+ transport system protein FeoA